MALNTGKKIVLTLKRIEQNSGLPTGETKPNVIGDPDYIAPSMDVTSCPITVTTTCPTVAATGDGNDSILFEFSLDNTVVNNPNIYKVRINAKISTTTEAFVDFILPNPTPNFFTGSLIGLLAMSTYTLSIDYINSSDTIIASCEGLGNIII